ncbi:MAG: response regulator, partial [Aquabacterium sp.]
MPSTTPADLSAPPRVVRLLHLEDSELDHLLMLAHLQRGGIEAQAVRIESERELLEALLEDWDVVISDYSLPGFSGLTALEMIKASGKMLPFILVSGEIGEDLA